MRDHHPIKSRTTAAARAVGVRHCGWLALALAAGPSLPAAAGSYASGGSFSVAYTFTTSASEEPTDIGGGRDLTVNRYLATTINEAGKGLLHDVAGHCTNIRITDRGQRTIDSKGYCRFKDGDGDLIFAEYTTGVVPAGAITFTLTFTSGSGKYDGITGQARATNTNNLDDQGAYQAAGKLVGDYAIKRPGLASEAGTHDQD